MVYSRRVVIDTSFHLVMDFADSYGVTDIARLVVYGNNVSGLACMMAYAEYKMLSYYPYSGIFYLPDGKNRKIYFRHVF